MLKVTSERGGKGEENSWSPIYGGEMKGGENWNEQGWKERRGRKGKTLNNGESQTPV